MDSLNSALLSGFMFLSLYGCHSPSKSSDNKKDSSEKSVKMKELFGIFKAEASISAENAERLGYVLVIDGRVPDGTNVEDFIPDSADYPVDASVVHYYEKSATSSAQSTNLLSMNNSYELVNSGGVVVTSKFDRNTLTYESSVEPAEGIKITSVHNFQYVGQTTLKVSHTIKGLDQKAADKLKKLDRDNSKIIDGFLKNPSISEYFKRIESLPESIGPK